MSRLAQISDTTGPLAALSPTLARTRSPARVTSSRRSSWTMPARQQFRGPGPLRRRLGPGLGRPMAATRATLSYPATLDGYTYTYDRPAIALSDANAKDRHLSETYTYDNLNRLTSATRNGGPDGNLDARQPGQPLEQQRHAASIERRPERDSANEIQTISASQRRRLFDAAGNMTTTPQPGTVVATALAYCASMMPGTVSCRSATAAARSGSGPISV